MKQLLDKTTVIQMLLLASHRYYKNIIMEYFYGMNSVYIPYIYYIPYIAHWSEGF